MKLQSVQKIIKIGSSSRGVTLPTRDLDALGLQAGDNIVISFGAVEQPDAQEDILREYKVFKTQYAETLKNLKDR